MFCENIFCVYWKEHQCILDSITINSQGICNEYIEVVIEEELLQERREKLLQRFEDERLLYR